MDGRGAAPASGGITPQHGTAGQGGDSPSDSDSDAGGYPAGPSGGGSSSLGSNALWAGFQNTVQQREQEQQRQAREAAEQARQKAAREQREIDAQRAAERAEREQAGSVDMLGQSNMCRTAIRTFAFCSISFASSAGRPLCY